MSYNYNNYGHDHSHHGHGHSHSHSGPSYNDHHLDHDDHHHHDHGYGNLQDHHHHHQQQQEHLHQNNLTTTPTIQESLITRTPPRNSSAIYIGSDSGASGDESPLIGRKKGFGVSIGVPGRTSSPSAGAELPMYKRSGYFSGKSGAFGRSPGDDARGFNKGGRGIARLKMLFRLMGASLTVGMILLLVWVLQRGYKTASKKRVDTNPEVPPVEPPHAAPPIPSSSHNGSFIDSPDIPPIPDPSHPFNFNEPDPESPSASQEHALWDARRRAVHRAFTHAWTGYTSYAWGFDELQPISKTGTSWLNMGLTILDALDTALVMGDRGIYEQASGWIKQGGLTMDADVNANVFETTIRVLGGLLAAYHLDGERDQELLAQAVRVADKFLPAYKTESKIPMTSIHLKSGKPAMGDSHYSSTSEATTVQMEMKYLSYLTGDPKYWNAAQTVMTVLDSHDPGLDGLVPIYIDPSSGQYAGREIRLGSRADSYYEYLGKQYLLTNFTEPGYHRMYTRSINGVKNHLLMRSAPHNLLYIRELPGGIDQQHNEKMDHLVCYLPATLAIVATQGRRVPRTAWDDGPLPSDDTWRTPPPPGPASPQQDAIVLTPNQKLDLRMAEEITRACYEMYHQTATGLAPEIVYFNPKPTKDDTATSSSQQALDMLRGRPPVVQVPTSVGTAQSVPDDKKMADFQINQLDGHNLLRPETVESLLVMYRITGERKYREWGWKIFRAFERWTRVESGGYTSLNDVRQIPPPPRGKMESFFLGETLKYFYLLFAEPDVIPLDKYVFNTECHPFPRFQMPESMRDKLVWLKD